MGFNHCLSPSKHQNKLVRVLPSQSKECNNQGFLLDSLEKPFPLSNLRTSLLSFGFSSFSQARLPNLLICLEPTGSTLWSTNIAMARKSTEFWWYIPGQNGDFPWRYVSLPQGVLSFSLLGCFPKMPPMLFFLPIRNFTREKSPPKTKNEDIKGFGWCEQWSFLIPSGLCLGSTTRWLITRMTWSMFWAHKSQLIWHCYFLGGGYRSNLWPLISDV